MLLPLSLASLLLSTLTTAKTLNHIPGYSRKLESTWHSDFVKVNIPEKPNLELVYHYILIESEHDPVNDDLLLWTNGGPGASSLWGLFTEVGPLWLDEASLETDDFHESGVPTLYRNNNTWSQFANLLIMTGPPPVGFGYCNPVGPSGNGTSCGDWDDETTAKANFAFLEGFFKQHPEFETRNNDFYISGESYAGIYIPTLTREILAHADSVPNKLLKGIAIGDGCIGTDLICSMNNKPSVTEVMFTSKFLFGHGQVSTPVFKDIVSKCADEFKAHETSVRQLTSPRFNFFRQERSLTSQAQTASKECLDAYYSMKKKVGYYFAYNLYDECWSSSNLPQLKSKLGGALTDYPCGGGGALNEYLANSQVRRALGISCDAKFISGDNGSDLKYTSTEHNLIPFHKKLATIENRNFRTLIYNGDTDPMLNTFFAEWWTNMLGLESDEDQTYRPWTLDGKHQQVGYLTRFKVADGLKYDYVTIRGSGHMVPQMKPRAATEMMRAWLKNEDWKQYIPDAYQPDA